jgi:3-oxoadipate CoA-transferase, beta subunit
MIREYLDRGALSRAEIAAMIAADIPRGSYVNLGIGQPTTVADFLSPDSGVVLHTENGMLGMGPAADHDAIDPDLINAGKTAVTETPGTSYFHHADSFGMIRGGHLDVCVLGAFQVAVNGDLANWHTGESGAIPAVGGAMDLAIGAKQVFVMMSLFTKGSSAKTVPRCSYPLSGRGCVTRVYTDHAVLLLGQHKVRARDLRDIPARSAPANRNRPRLRLASRAAGRLGVVTATPGYEPTDRMADGAAPMMTRHPTIGDSGRRDTGLACLRRSIADQGNKRTASVRAFVRERI